MKASKSFFLLSFLPAIAYWYLEANYPVRIAIIGGLSLAILEMAIEKLWTKHVHSLSRFNFMLILFLGGLSLLGDEGIWFKLQPMFTGLGIGIYIFYRNFQGNGLLWEMMVGLQQQQQLPPRDIIQYMEKNISIFFIIYGGFMGVVAISLATDYWLFFKTIGFYIIFAFFFVLQFFLLRKKMRALYAINYKKF